MPKITLTFDIPEKTESLFQEYDNIPTYQLTQHDQYETSLKKPLIEIQLITKTQPKTPSLVS